MKKFKLLPIPALVFGVFTANTFAQTDAVVLDTINVTNHQGLKVKTNVVTTQIKDESTETDLRGLLKNEPSIAIGGVTALLNTFIFVVWDKTPLMLKWTMRILMHKFTTIKVVIC